MATSEAASDSSGDPVCIPAAAGHMAVSCHDFVMCQLSLLSPVMVLPIALRGTASPVLVSTEYSDQTPVKLLFQVVSEEKRRFTNGDDEGPSIQGVPKVTKVWDRDRDRSAVTPSLSGPERGSSNTHQVR